MTERTQNIQKSDSDRIYNQPLLVIEASETDNSTNTLAPRKDDINSTSELSKNMFSNSEKKRKSVKIEDIDDDSADSDELEKKKKLKQA
jgi:hypothetical protein